MPFGARGREHSGGRRSRQGPSDKRSRGSEAAGTRRLRCATRTTGVLATSCPRDGVVEAIKVDDGAIGIRLGRRRDERSCCRAARAREHRHTRSLVDVRAPDVAVALGARLFQLDQHDARYIRAASGSARRATCLLLPDCPLARRYARTFVFLLRPVASVPVRTSLATPPSLPALLPCSRLWRRQQDTGRAASWQALRALGILEDGCYGRGQRGTTAAGDNTQQDATRTFRRGASA